MQEATQGFTITVWPGNKIANRRTCSLDEVHDAIRKHVTEIREKHGEYADEALTNYGGAASRVLEAIGGNLGTMVMPWDVDRGDHVGPPSLTAAQFDELTEFARATMWPDDQ